MDTKTEHLGTTTKEDEVLSQAPTSRRTSITSLSSDETAPPAYEDVVVDGSAPRYTAALGFPAKFNLYYSKTSWKSSTWVIGEHRSQPIFALVLASGWKGTTLNLHRGPSSDSPVIAEVTSKGTWSRQHVISLPGHDIQEEIHTSLNWKTHNYTFTAVVLHGEKPVPERFEWRQSHGQEVKLLSNHAWGWKLVRLDSDIVPQDQAIPEMSDKGKKRDLGETSDGKEVVAVWADNMKWSKTKMLKFEFLGSAANSNLGEIFEIMAVSTGMRIWQIMRTGTTGGGSAKPHTAILAGTSAS